jgi:hypothetical protein
VHDTTTPRDRHLTAPFPSLSNTSLVNNIGLPHDNVILAMPPVDNDRHNNSNNNIIIHDRHDHRASNSVVLDIPERDTVTRPVMSEASDINLLHRSVADAGRWAFGMILVEVWVMSPDNTALYRSDSGVSKG